MSYCVNCGVELAASEKRCPLCGVEVINPSSPFDPTAARPYPDRHEAIRHRAIRVVAARVLSLLMAIPFILVLLLDLIEDGSMSWSLIPAASIAFAFLAFVFPCLFKKPILWMFMIFSTLAAAAYLFVLHIILKGGWYYLFALPLTAMTGAATIGIYLMIRSKKASLPLKLIIILLIIMVFVLLVQLVTELNFRGEIRFDWSLYVAVSCGMLSLVVLIVGRLYRKSERFRKKLFF
ncbi:MAG: zinc ribbon domain-containing protein [Clostridia bacterium]|nr:zinc ribbon domain-containing protein [Clostridia bacterium]